MSIAIFLKDSFDSAHWLPGVPDGHKCKTMHGHTYRICLYVQGSVNPSTGWIIDYAELKEQWDKVHKLLDHKTLNDELPNPTCELIALWIADRLPMVDRIELKETERCGVVWNRYAW